MSITMRCRSVFGLVVLVALCFMSTGCATGYQNGWLAYESGAHEVAYNEWRPLAEEGNPRAQYLLGVLHEEGLGAAKDDVLAVHWYQHAADQGFAPAQNNLGLMYYKGEGVQRDHQQAAMWYERAAAQGNAHAMNNLAVMHLLGQVAPSDAEEANRLLHLAAASGNANSKQILQSLNNDGIDTMIPVTASASAMSSTP